MFNGAAPASGGRLLPGAQFFRKIRWFAFARVQTNVDGFRQDRAYRHREEEARSIAVSIDSKSGFGGSPGHGGALSILGARLTFDTRTEFGR